MDGCSKCLYLQVESGAYCGAITEVPSPGRRVGAVNSARLMTQESAQAGGHVKTAAEGHPEQSGGLGLEGEPAGARVRASRSGGCNRATLWPAGAYDYMRRASAEGGHNAVNHSPKETLTISYEQWQTIGSVAEGRRQDVGGPPQGGPGVLQASKRAYRPPAETTVSEEQA